MVAKTTPVKTGTPKPGSNKQSSGKTSVLAFLRQVRAEMLKVTWPSRRETGISTVMVLVMVVLACCFFFLSDWVIATFVRTVIGFLGGVL